MCVCVCVVWVFVCVCVREGDSFNKIIHRIRDCNSLRRTFLKTS